MPTRSSSASRASISVVSSTCGMKLPGGTMPRCGCIQRSSASVPATSPLASDTLAWCQTCNSPRAIASGKAAEQDQVVAAGAVVGAVVARDRRLARSRPVHRDARLLQQLLGCLRMARRLRDADAGFDVDRQAVDQVRLVAGRLDALARQRRGLLLRDHAGQPVGLHQREQRTRRHQALRALAAPAPARACRTRCRTCSGSPESCSAA